MANIWPQWKPVAGFGAALILIVGALILVNHIMAVRMKSPRGHQVARQVIMTLLTFASAIALVISLPISESLRGQILALLGIILSATIALSSTTFLGNALAGILLRSQKSFRGGDFIEVKEYFGRVSGRGLFHVEIQTQNRDLVNIPNLFIATNPVKVIRSKGTIISAEVSLGYDVARQIIQECLLKAAGSIGLEDPFVLIMELGDFSVTYCVRGLLKDTDKLLTSQSSLKTAVIDHLHHGGVEIVSPTFMNTRQVQDRIFIPGEVQVTPEPPQTAKLEKIAFDRADIAENIEERLDQESDTRARIKALEKELAETKDDAQKEILRARIETLTARAESIQEQIVETKEKLEVEKS